ncbi:hypothetical protein C8R43DRAFT_1147415 [Mycena crocata]|nr:hypothetical protein C8R43DRAFT_1147415 [Mycena crocata]
MLSTKFILTVLASVALSSASPTPVGPPTPLAPATITVCSGAINPPSGCVTIPVVSQSCISLTGGLSFLNDEVSNARVPGGFVCTFFDDFGCSNGGVNGHDVAVLTGGTWNLSRVQGISGTQNFNDLTSSISVGSGKNPPRGRSSSLFDPFS